MRSAALLVALLLLAGCASTKTSDSATGTTVPATAAAKTLPAPATVAKSNATGTAAWWTMTTQATPDGGLSGVNWTIPAGALHPFAQGFDGWTALTLEVAPLVANNTGVTAWSLEAFTYHDGAAELRGTYLSMPFHAQVSSLAVFTGQGDGKATFTPFWQEFVQTPQEHDFASGAKLGFVLTATGSGPLGLAFRVLDHAPQGQETPPKTSRDAVAAMAKAGPAERLAPIGQGNGAQVAIYLELADALLPPVPGGLFGVREWTDAVQRSEALPTDGLWPLVTTHDLQLSSHFDAPSGYGYGAFYLFGEEGAGVATTATNVEGHASSTTQPYLAVDAAGVSPYYVLVGDGAGGSKVGVHVQEVDTDSVNVLTLEHLDFGATLQHLLGVPAASSQSSGLLGQRAQLVGDDLVIPGPVPTTLAGWGAPLRAAASGASA